MSLLDTTLAAFTPDAVPVHLLRRITVARGTELGVLHDAFRAATTSKARPNVLVVGPRGSGKTHLLALAEQQIGADGELSAALAVARLPEDLYGVTSYWDLLEATILQLAGDGALVVPALELEHRMADARAASHDDLALESLLLDALGGRVLVWMIENLDRVLRVLGVEGQRKVRALLHNHGVVLVASTPALFWGVSSHDAPLYGAFRVLNLGELTVDEGRELLLRIADLRGDKELAAFLASERGLRRVQAIADLAGGLPRLWHLLAGCMTIELLDELVPLFVKLLDQLNPYYRARLDELSDAKAKLLVHLCRTPSGAEGNRPVGAMTVRDLARIAGMSSQAASKQLGELERARFVRAHKVAGGDQRTTHYELREPLLRHCLELKESRGKPLELIVTVLRDWHEAAALRRALAHSAAAGTSERYLLAALEPRSAAPAASDELYSSGHPGDLLAGARRWLTGDREGGDVRSWLAAVVAEGAVLAEWDGGADARAAVAARAESRGEQVSEAMGSVIAAALESPEEATGRTRPVADVARGVATRLLAAARKAETLNELLLEDSAALRLLAAGWLVATDRSSEALPALERLSSDTQDLAHDRLRLAVGAELAYALAETGRAAEAMDMGASVEQDRRALFGPADPDTLYSRANLASWIGEAGDPATALDLFKAVAEDCSRVRGVDHPYTLWARHNLAHWTGVAGDPAGARDLFAGVVDDRSRVLGEDHPDTLKARHNHAWWTGKAGDATTARDLFASVVDDWSRVLGMDHRSTLLSRSGLALNTWAAGDVATAVSLLESLRVDARQAVGGNGVWTMEWSTFYACLLCLSGDPVAALNVLTEETSLAEAGRELVGACLSDVAENVLSRFREAPSLAAEYLADAVERLSPRGRLGIVFGITRTAPLDPIFASWLLDSAAELGLATQVPVALVLPWRPPTVTAGEFLRHWIEATGGRSELEYKLLHRVLQAALALLDGGQEPLVALPPEERVLARAAAGIRESPADGSVEEGVDELVGVEGDEVVGRLP